MPSLPRTRESSSAAVGLISLDSRVRGNDKTAAFLIFYKVVKKGIYKGVVFSPQSSQKGFHSNPVILSRNSLQTFMKHDVQYGRVHTFQTGLR